jgi:hypothetical protein
MLMWSVLVASFVMLVLMFVSNLYLSDRRATSSGSSELRKIRHSSWPMRDELMGANANHSHGRRAPVPPFVTELPLETVLRSKQNRRTRYFWGSAGVAALDKNRAMVREERS